MRSALQQQAGQGGATSSSAARSAEAARAASAEAAQLDARLEVAAKKAALASLESQAGGMGGDVVADAPPLPGGSSGRIVIERDGKTIILDNPTAEQIAAVSGAGTSAPQVEGWALVAMSGMVFAATIILAALFLKHRRTRQPVQPEGTERLADARMARIENAIESIAVEVERISEGQRFTARLLSEGAAVPVAVADRGDAVLDNRAAR